VYVSKCPLEEELKVLIHIATAGIVEATRLEGFIESLTQAQIVALGAVEKLAKLKIARVILLVGLLLLIAPLLIGGLLRLLLFGGLIGAAVASTSECMSNHVSSSGANGNTTSSGRHLTHNTRSLSCRHGRAERRLGCSGGHGGGTSWSRWSSPSWGSSGGSTRRSERGSGRRCRTSTASHDDTRVGMCLVDSEKQRDATHAKVELANEVGEESEKGSSR